MKRNFTIRVDLRTYAMKCNTLVNKITIITKEGGEIKLNMVILHHFLSATRTSISQKWTPNTKTKNNKISYF